MKIKDIAKRGLKGRQKDTLLIKIVIILAFIFIVTSTVFQASIDKTKSEQQFDLYGEWHAAYLGGNQETVKKINGEPEVDKVGDSLIIGESEECGVIGTFNQDLIDMGRFSLYKGRYPEEDNEIMLELNQISNMNLDLEVGQKIDVNVELTIVDKDAGPYIMELNKEFYEQGIYPNYLRHHETPFEHVGDVLTVVVSDYFFYYPADGEASPDVIRETGFLEYQKVILKKEFTITGILQTYTDKWDLGGYKAPNAFITEEGGKLFTEALYGTTLEDFSDYEMDYNIFLTSDSLKENLFSHLASDYPNRIKVEEDRVEGINYWFWMSLYGMTDEEVETSLEANKQWFVERKPDDWADKSLEGDNTVGSKMEVNTSNFRKNTFSYPDDKGSTEYVLALTIIAVIFIATALAIFQIFLTQMKRRSRKIVLLKSIGATKTQVIKMLLYEGIYFLKSGLLIGVPIGFGASALIIFSMNKFGGRSLQFYVLPSLFFLGLLAGILALFIGMAIPTIYAVNIPLVGTMSKPPKHKKIKHKNPKDKKIHRQSFSYINWQYFKLNKSKTFISFGISLITITILLITVLLNFFSFGNYRNKVIANSRPDYAMEAIYGEMDRDIPIMEEELMAIDGVESTEVYKVGKQLFLWYDGIEDNEILQSFENLLPSRLLTSHFSKYNKGLEDEADWLNNAIYTKIYAIEPKGRQFNKYNSMVTEGTINKKKFAAGEEVILLIPMYIPGDTNVEKTSFSEEQVLSATNEDNRMNWLFENSGAFQTTYNIRYNDYYFKQDHIKPGDTIYLSADKEKLDGDSYASSYITQEVKVGGIIHYFPKGGVWPFSNSAVSYVVISSIDGMESLYPRSRFGLQSMDIKHLEVMVNLIYPYSYGRTVCYINTDSKQTDVILDARLLSYANNRGYTLYNYKDSNIQLYYEAFNNAIIIGLLGITSAAIALIILYNTNISKMEQDKNRIGILQALGVTREEFSRHYLKVGIFTGLLALLIIHIGLLVALLLTSIGTVEGISMTFPDYIRDIFTYRLWLYPWVAHIIICIAFFLLTVLIYYLPSKNITKKYPVENIRSLGR